MEIFANKQQTVSEVKRNLDKWPGGSFPIDGWAEGPVTPGSGREKEYYPLRQDASQSPVSSHSH